MARNRSGADLIDDAMKRADVEGYDDRHPRAEVLRYVNQGKAELRDLMIEARGASYFRSSTPWTFTTTANTLLYTTGFPTDFYRLIAIRASGDSILTKGLEQMQALEEPALLDPETCVGPPSHYDLRPNGVAIYPRHEAGYDVVVEWIPASPDLTDSSSSNADGVDGWEEYIVAFAARCIAMKDDEPGVVASCEQEMARLGTRIKKLAPNRDAYRPKRVQDVRGARMFGRMGRIGRPRGDW